MDLSPHPSPTYPLRSIRSTAILPSGAPSVASPAGTPLPPPLSFAPRIPADLPPLSAPSRVIARLPAQPSKRTARRSRAQKRQRLQKSSSSSSGEDGDLLHTQESRTRPTMLLTALHTAPTNIQVATQGLALVRPVQSNTLALVRPGRNSSVAPAPLLQATVGDNHNVSSYADAMSTGDDEVVESLYEEPRRGNVADLRELCELVNKLLEDQAKLSHDIKQIDTRTQQMTANQQNGSNRPNRDGNYVSPPEPVLEINWDQTVQHDAPAGRRRRAKRRVLLMALIRETIF
ncbi:hypothetical protein RSOLAG1IB_08624 [Rhizoctonia solani AG-1 IB]|uniref:Uncharacterized protein n=1 Tax=Thanatephorus cucumeris (strain AG1-IB / isolate 7/3/14) TaxID=1108050 RepID=A0A0B7FQU3_THACB|nr:hypothetical protein RSOLAG1IB_08624 [Rhizoctonia solani AG-1 IB]